MAVSTLGEDDVALVEKARSGDYGAFEELVKRHQGKTYALALGVLHSAAEAEEVVQETFLSAFEHLDTFRGDARFTTWIYRVATNHALMRLRKKRPLAVGGIEELEAAPQAFTGGTSPFDALSLWARRPDDALQDREVTRALEASLDGLGAEERALLLARVINDASHEELAHQFGTTVPAIKSRLHRARLRLRQLLDEKLRGKPPEARG
jgi:RNA polymerase sigma-70 factor (ECF subfamily)